MYSSIPIYLSHAEVYNMISAFLLVCWITVQIVIGFIWNFKWIRPTVTEDPRSYIGSPSHWNYALVTTINQYSFVFILISIDFTRREWWRIYQRIIRGGMHHTDNSPFLTSGFIWFSPWQNLVIVEEEPKMIKSCGYVLVLIRWSEWNTK
jgi:hypothetical protein